MSWSIGYDNNWKRDVGYGVPAYCDHPNCLKQIDRGLSYVCGGEPYGGDCGCGLYFCEEHLSYITRKKQTVQVCKRCERVGSKPFLPTPDHPDWLKHKLDDESWAQWRDENPAAVEAIKERLDL